MLDKEVTGFSEYMNGHNFFDVEREFFIIDSEKLNDVKTHLYGYMVQDTGIYEEKNITDYAVRRQEGCGCYVYVEVKDGKITISQDFNGSWGVYIFRSGESFILSNSFFRLLEYVKDKYPLTLDRDYANHIFTFTLASLAYDETPVKEIRLVDKDAVITIDVAKKSLDMSYIDYEPDSYLLSTKEGIDMLDKWFRRWTTIFRKIHEKSGQITVALSGGFDSRITFLLLLESGIDMNDVRVHSINDGLHTHSEDYEIASSIADYYGFELNKDFDTGESLNYSLEDTLNIYFYIAGCFHKEFYIKLQKKSERQYVIPGAGGESVRAHWDISATDFLNQSLRWTNRYDTGVSGEMRDSVERIIKSAYDAIGKKYNIEDPESIDYPLNMHREVRCRSHFGKSSVEDYFANNILLSPLIDPTLRKLRLSDEECNDNNLLMTLMYVRYCPKLLEFKFEGGRSIDVGTIEHAKELNNRFPIDADAWDIAGREAKEQEFSLIKVDGDVLDKLAYNNERIDGAVPNEYLKKVFDSVSFRKLFATRFDESIYGFAKRNAEKAKYYPLRECYSVISIAKVIEDLEMNECRFAPSLTDSFDRFIKHNDYVPLDEREALDRFRNYITSRVDIKMTGADKSQFELVSVSDRAARVIMPDWFQKGGVGYLVTSHSGMVDIKINAHIDGDIIVRLRGVYEKSEDGKNVPYWIDYTNCTFNGEKIFDGDKKPAWHDKPIALDCHVSAGELIEIHVEWLLHMDLGPNVSTNDIEKIDKQIKQLSDSMKAFQEKVGGSGLYNKSSNEEKIRKEMNEAVENARRQRKLAEEELDELRKKVDSTEKNSKKRIELAEASLNELRKKMDSTEKINKMLNSDYKKLNQKYEAVCEKNKALNVEKLALISDKKKLNADKISLSNKNQNIEKELEEIQGSFAYRFGSATTKPGRAVYRAINKNSEGRKTDEK